MMSSPCFEVNRTAVANSPSAAFCYSDADCVPIFWNLLKASSDGEFDEDEQNASCFYFEIFATIGKTYSGLPS